MANAKVFIPYTVNTIVKFCVYLIVCVKFLTKFYQRLEDKSVDKSDTEMVEGRLMKFCKETRDDKEERFVSYLSILLVTRELL